MRLHRILIPLYFFVEHHFFPKSGPHPYQVRGRPFREHALGYIGSKHQGRIANAARQQGRRIMSAPTESAKPNYTVKKVERVVTGTDVEARIFTLASGEAIPWHYHSESTDYYFVLRGKLTIETRNPDGQRVLDIGGRYQIRPGTGHLISNRGTDDCEFLLLQGVGKYDWLKVKG
jgi:quercetin dioxygenase-like cupin family protein